MHIYGLLRTNLFFIPWIAQIQSYLSSMEFSSIHSLSLSPTAKMLHIVFHNDSSILSYFQIVRNGNRYLFKYMVLHSAWYDIIINISYMFDVWTRYNETNHVLFCICRTLWLWMNECLREHLSIAQVALRLVLTPVTSSSYWLQLALWLVLISPMHILFQTSGICVSDASSEQ